MNRQEMIKTIRDLVGSKMVFDEQWNTRVVVGENRPVCAVTQKYIYMGCKCYVKAVWENDDILVSAIRCIPIYGTLYGEITAKVELDSLNSRDLEIIYNSVIDYFNWKIGSIPELKAQLEECLRLQTKYNKVFKK